MRRPRQTLACAGVVAAALVIGATACGQTYRVVGASDAGETVELSSGERLSIVLEFNASIGDDWRVADEGDAEVISYLGDDVELDDPEADGSGGTLTLTFEAVGDGQTTIELVNCYRGSCPDDPDPAPEAEALSFPVTVGS